MTDVRTAGRPSSRPRQGPAWLEVVRAHNEPKIEVLASQIRYAEKFIESSVGYVERLLSRRVPQQKVNEAVSTARFYEQVLARLKQSRERLTCELLGVLYDPGRITAPPSSETAGRLIDRHKTIAEGREKKRRRDRRLASGVVPKKYVDVTRVVHKDDQIHFYWPEGHPLHGHAIYERQSNGTCGKQIYFRPFGVKRPMKEVARRVHEERLLELAKRHVLRPFQYNARPVRIRKGDVSIWISYPESQSAVLTVRDSNLSDTLRFAMLKDGEIRDIEWK